MAPPLRLPVVLLALAVAGGVAWWAWPRVPAGAPALDTPGCHDGATVPGIDVSYYQEAIKWPRVRRAGLRFAFIRVSDSTSFADTRFERNWRESKRAGLLRGAYQYFRPDQSATAQADLLIARLQADPGELPPVIDVEYEGGKTPAQIAAAVRVWVARVRERLAVEPIVYTGPDFWRTEVGNADLTSQPLWLAHYTTRCPTVPAPWTRWTFWQHSEHGRVPGIIGRVDMNVFAGTMADLEAFARRSRLAPRAAAR